MKPNNGQVYFSHNFFAENGMHALRKEKRIHVDYPYAPNIVFAKKRQQNYLSTLKQ